MLREVGSHQSQTDNGVTTAELADANARMRAALSEVDDYDDRADVEQAIDNLEEAASAPDPGPEKVRRRARVLQRAGSAVGGALLSAAVSEGAQVALQAASVV